jgi:hypothetical protein
MILCLRYQIDHEVDGVRYCAQYRENRTANKLAAQLFQTPESKMRHYSLRE